MNYQTMLLVANQAMAATFLLLLVSLTVAFWLPLESLMLTVVAHLSNIVLATALKISYILRLIAQKELGLQLR